MYLYILTYLQPGAALSVNVNDSSELISWSLWSGSGLTVINNPLCIVVQSCTCHNYMIPADCMPQYFKKSISTPSWHHNAVFICTWRHSLHKSVLWWNERKREVRYSDNECGITIGIIYGGDEWNMSPLLFAMGDFDPTTFWKLMWKRENCLQQRYI